MVFIKNNIQKLVATRSVSPTCQLASFLKQILMNFVDIILIKEKKSNQAVA
jgi:hypothetical protein